MRKYASRPSPFLIAACLAGLMTGCGGKGGQKPPTEAGAPGQKAAAPEGSAAPVVAETVAAGLARDKKWTASSQIEIWSESGKITDDQPKGIFFHTKEEESPWLEIDLEKPVSVSAVDVLNRTDCCGDRAVPLAVELSSDRKAWREVARRNEPFVVWKAAFPAQEARYVRLHVLRKTHFHLERVGIR